MGFSEGGVMTVDPLSQVHGASNSVSVSTEAPILAIRGAATLNSVVNRVPFYLKRLGIAVDGTKVATINLYRDPATLTGASWVSVDSGQSTIEFDASATAFTGGDLVGAQVLPKVGGDNFDLTDLGLDGTAGDVFLVTAASSSSTDAFASFIVEELF